MKLSGILIAILSALLLLSSPVSAKSKKHHVHHSSTHADYSTQTINGEQNLAAVINDYIQNTDPHAEIGVQIKSMKTNETFYAHNEERGFTIASTLKLFTAAAAYAFLGPDYKFSTQVVTDAKSTNNGVVDGNVYLVHSGDPSLTYSDLTDLMVALKSLQIHTINGNVYVDNTAYDQENYGPGWSWDDTRYCYAAPINASIINHNCVSFSISPSKSEGRLVNITENPRFFYSAFSNDVVTKSAWTRSCHVSLTLDNNNTIDMRGCMPKGHYSRGASIVIANVVKYNESMLQSLFQEFGIQVNGHISAQAAPPNLSVLASHDSKPLHVLINEMLKKSDNIIAGSLFKKMGEVYTNKPGSWSNGSYAVKAILSEKAGVNTASLQLIDGSGLSIDNRVTPAQLMQVLDYGYHNYSTNYEFVSALPIAGIDGTLKYRLSNVRGKVRAKTGTLAKTGVISLAGYAISKDKEPIAFVIVINGRNGNVWKYREMEDKIVTALTNFSR